MKHVFVIVGWYCLSLMTVFHGIRHDGVESAFWFSLAVVNMFVVRDHLNRLFPAR